ncbi:MAG: hypothetical protein ACKVU4_09150 [Phycisphaerales bacterium]
MPHAARDNGFSDEAGVPGGPNARVPGPDRRKTSAGNTTGLERRRGPGRRLSDFIKAAEEGEMTPEQFLFLMAIESFKRANGVMYPSWTDVLEVVRLLGYRKTMPSALKLAAAEDWNEAADAPSGVRTERQLQRQHEAEVLQQLRRAERDAA